MVYADHTSRKMNDGILFDIRNVSAGFLVCREGTNRMAVDPYIPNANV